jgi:serine/threonine-protein kinase
MAPRQGESEERVGGTDTVDGEIGKRVAGKYELRRLIGSGAMGAVYEGVHIDLGKRVAIKLVRPEFCGSHEVVARFRREARAASAVESEHITQIFDFGRDDTLGLYMVIEYLDGEDLETRLARERCIAPHEAASIGWQIARGLARAHAVGVIHRDLKPANIFLTWGDGGALLAKILDFGISKLQSGKWAQFSSTDGGAEPTLTELGTTLGTPQYMSPEQCEGRIALDERTDVWSLCAVVYEALAGEPAIPDAGGYLAAMQHIVSNDVCPLARRAPWVPRRLAQVIDSGLARDREARIRDAATLAARLLAAKPEPIAPAGPSHVERSTEGDAGPPFVPPDDIPPASSAEDRVETFVRGKGLAVSIARSQGGPQES